MEWAQKKAETKEWMALASNLSDPEDTIIETANDTSEPKETKPTEMNLKALKKEELVELCVEKGLAKSGTKDVLIERLLKSKK
jgi:hypothetical protein